MASPIMTDEELAEEGKVVAKKEENKGLKETMKEMASEGESVIKKALVEETERELKEDIPSNYIEINLVSNGRIEGIPSKLHFRCYSASDAIDLNVTDEQKVKSLVKVLSRLNYEGFDVGLLPVQDVLYILYKLHGAFISNTISKKVYIDDTIEDEELLNNDDNLEQVDIPITSIVYAYLGKNYDDENLPQNVKVPFTIRDKETNESATFRYSVLNDMIMAETYCKNYYKDEFIKYGDIRSALSKIHNISNEEKMDKALDDFISANEERTSEYYKFMIEYSRMVAKIVQAESIVSYNGKVLETLDEKWDCYSNKMSVSLWESYVNVVKDFPFGIKDDIDVYLPSLKKKVHRRVGFQFNDFLHIDRPKDSDRCVVEFD